MCFIFLTSRQSGFTKGITSKLLGTLKNLRDLGNTLIVVEHDEDTMRAADLLLISDPEQELTAVS